MLIFEGDIPVLNCVFEEIQLISKGCYSSEDRDLNPLFLSAGSTADFEDQDSGLVTIFLVPTAIIIALIAYHALEQCGLDGVPVSQMNQAEFYVFS